MKRVIGVLVLGVVLFGLSAGASLFLRKQEHAADEGAAGSAELKKKVMLAGMGSPDVTTPRPGIRNSPNPTPENVVQLAATLRQQQDVLKNREQQLATRHKHLELIFQDFKSERKELDDARLRVTEELKALQEKLETLERKASDIDRQKQKLTDQAKDIKQSVFEFEGVEQNRIKQMAAMYDTMDAEVAGEILVQMAETGKMDTAVKILATMRERQAARVLAQIGDHGVVVQMLDKMKGLKRPGATP